MCIWSDTLGGTPEYEAARAANAAARQIEREAFRALLATRPTTVAGCLALTAYLPGTVIENDHHLDEDMAAVLRALPTAQRRGHRDSSASEPAPAPAVLDFCQRAMLSAEKVDFSALDVRSLSHLYEAFHVARFSWKARGPRPYCNRGQLGDLPEFECERAGHIMDRIAEEIASRSPSSDEKRDDILMSRVSHEMLCNGRIHDNALSRRHRSRLDCLSPVHSSPWSFNRPGDPGATMEHARALSQPAQRPSPRPEPPEPEGAGRCQKAAAGRAIRRPEHSAASQQADPHVAMLPALRQAFAWTRDAHPLGAAPRTRPRTASLPLSCTIAGAWRTLSWPCLRPPRSPVSRPGAGPVRPCGRERSAGRRTTGWTINATPRNGASWAAIRAMMAVSGVDPLPEWAGFEVGPDSDAKWRR